MNRAAFESAALLHLNPAFAFVSGVSTFEVSPAWSPISREGEKQSGAHAKTIRAHLQASNGQEWRKQSGTDSTTMCANNPDHMRKQSGVGAKTIRIMCENNPDDMRKQSGSHAKTIRSIRKNNPQQTFGFCGKTCISGVVFLVAHGRNNPVRRPKQSD